MRHRLRHAVPRTAAPLGTLAGVGAAFVYVAAVDPGRPGHYPVCPFLSVTGLYCPACGGLRSAHAVAHGDLAAALGANAAAVLLFAAFAAFWIHWFTRAVRGAGYAFPVRLTAWHGWAAGALLLAFTVVRNTPLGTALVP
ncbi:DUF2752 domain-containing protein [Streptomyces sp. NBC_01795]|nr:MULTISPECIES: DUF2752 domain-containing protein [unclassified Streptomyces]WSA95380.1 DUF2752 domain-containing protein [Streptomyces sp. NBC_01795]WSB79797.1 DUF2752 domain-containing protein [Streptomyces sp. NBC_01775]WSS11996.1 DUF2752 domain-containing protein [Streptomyces sp. NBC_01186]WSS40710.1 DUF2752 domain-containing protein [Streptomyces sp. NBC_01187]